MADQFQEQIKAARRAGYTDDEIVGHLKDQDPRVSTALESGYNASEILGHLAPPRSTGEEVARKIGIAARGASEALAPVATGAATGFMMGGPVGAGVGALAGGLAVPVTDLAVQGYNRLAGGNVQMPSQVISNMLPGPRAETPTERVIQASGSALGNVGGSVAAGRAIVNAGRSAFGMPSPVAQQTLNIGEEAARRPVGQMVAAPLATAAGQTTTELTGNPLAGLAVGAATGMAAGVRPVKRGAVPTAEELAARSKANYDVLESSGFEIDSPQFNAHMNGMAAKLRSSAGYDPRTMPEVDAALAQLTAPAAKTVAELQTLRTIVSNAAKSIKPAERKAASQLLDEFDEYVMNAPAVSGDAKAAQAWKEARADYSKMKKSELITDIIDNAEVSQGTKDASIAGQLSALAKNPKKMRFFSSDEQEAIREAAKGGSLQSALRIAGKFLPVTPAAAIFTAFNPLGGYTAAAGMAAKGMADVRRTQQVNRLASQMRLGERPTVLEGAMANTPVFVARNIQNMLAQQNQP